MTEEKSPLPRDDEAKPVVWTPEDASRFLTAAIHEAQRPLAEALKDRPITSRAMTIIVAVLVLGAAVIALILSSQIEKADKAADEARKAREVILTDKAELQARTGILEDRLGRANSAMAGMRDSENDLKRARVDLQRSRRQNELLRSQISGLEMEKMALARQLEAVKAMAVDREVDADDVEAEGLGAETAEESASENTAGGEPRGNATTAVPPGAGFHGRIADAVMPEVHAAATTDSGAVEAPASPQVGDTTTPVAEQPAVKLPNEIAPAHAAVAVPAKATVSDAESSPVATLPASTPAEGAAEPAERENPPTLFEASLIDAAGSQDENTSPAPKEAEKDAPEAEAPSESGDGDEITEADQSAGE